MPRRLLGPLLMLGLLFPTLVPAQEAAFADETARRLVTGALLRSRVETQGGVRAVIRSRVRAGLLIPGQWNWRSRTLFHRESLGVSVFTGADEHREQVLMRRRGSPVVGDELMDKPPLWGSIGFDPEPGRPGLLGVMGLSLGTLAPDLPGGAAVGAYQVFDSTFVDPLSSRGPTVYRYSTGREMEIGDEDRLLQTVEFRPRDPSHGDLTGLVWFDAATGAPVRAILRPRGQWPLQGGVRGLARHIPLLPTEAMGRIDYLTISYREGTAGLAWPDVAHLHGTSSLFWDAVLLPVQMEWDLDWLAAPPTDSDDALPDPVIHDWGISPWHGYLTPYIRELDRIVGPPPAPSLLETVGKTLGSLRFNQVQGASLTAPYSVPLGARTTLRAQVQIPTSGFQLTSSASLEVDAYPRRYGIGGYSVLRDVNWMEGVNAVSTSLTAALTGYDDGHYYLASGGRVWMEGEDGPVRGSISLFAEDQRQVTKTVTWSVFPPDTMDAPPMDLTIDEGAYYGVRGRLDIQVGDDPQDGLILARLHGEAARGGRSFFSVGTTTDFVTPLPGPFTGGLRLQAGLANGDAPGQALYYLGGYKTIRGYPAAAAAGASTFILTGELATDVPLVRLVAFGEVGWADDLRRLFDQEPLATVGGGLSFGDGILRFDLARGLTRGGVWRFVVATSGLL